MGIILPAIKSSKVLAADCNVAGVTTLNVPHPPIHPHSLHCIATSHKPQLDVYRHHRSFPLDRPKAKRRSVLGISARGQTEAFDTAEVLQIRFRIASAPTRTSISHRYTAEAVIFHDSNPSLSITGDERKRRLSTSQDGRSANLSTKLKVTGRPRYFFRCYHRPVQLV